MLEPTPQSPGFAHPRLLRFSTNFIGLIVIQKQGRVDCFCITYISRMTPLDWPLRLTSDLLAPGARVESVRFTRHFGWRRVLPRRGLPLVPGVHNMNAGVPGSEPLNEASEPGRDLLVTDVFDGTKSVRAKSRCNPSRFEAALRTFTNPLKLFGPRFFDLPQVF